MATNVLLAKCPGCSRPLRVPAEWVGKPVRCKACGRVAMSRPKAAAANPAAPAPTAPVTPAVLPVAQPVLSAEPVAPVPAPVYAPPAPVYAPPLPQNAFGDISGAPSADAARSRRKRGNGLAVVAVGVFLLLLVAGAGAAAYFLLDAPAGGPQAAAPATPTALAHPTAEGDPATGPFPRRLMAVSVNNYLYANPVNFGRADKNRDIGSLVKWFQTRWKVPAEQTWLVSDAAPGKPTPTLKPVIEGAVEQFLKTSRAQDRIVLLFVGHAVAVEGEGYLAPIEGELGEAKTLIPLKWLYEKLAACPAQEKVLVLDVCRLDPTRGTERPGSAPMAEDLDKALKSPPAGVTIVTACSAGEKSLEYSYAPVSGREVFGGLFLNQVFFSSTAGGTGIQRPGDPLPVAQLFEILAKSVTRGANEFSKEKQTPALHKGAAGAAVAYDPRAGLAERFEVAGPGAGSGGVVPPDQVAAVLSEIDVPPLRLKAKEDQGQVDETVRIESLIPFTAESMADYLKDADPQKSAYRKAVVAARKTLADVRDRNATADLPEEFAGPINESLKAEVLKVQRAPAVAQLKIEEAIEQLEKVAEDSKDDSKRWQAHHAYILAQCKARLAYLGEYNAMLAKVRKDELPPLDQAAGHKGWRLASVEKLSSGREGRRIADEAKTLLEELAKENPGTPWEVLAKREKDRLLGMEWVASNLGQAKIE